MTDGGAHVHLCRSRLYNEAGTICIRLFSDQLSRFCAVQVISPHSARRWKARIPHQRMPANFLPLPLLTRWPEHHATALQSRRHTT
jgi:hypothetical protein